MTKLLQKVVYRKWILITIALWFLRFKTIIIKISSCFLGLRLRLLKDLLIASEIIPPVKATVKIGRRLLRISRSGKVNAGYRLTSWDVLRNNSLANRYLLICGCWFRHRVHQGIVCASELACDPLFGQKSACVLDFGWR